MRSSELKRRLRAAQIFAALAALVTALSGFGPQSLNDGGAEAGHRAGLHRAGLTGDVRIVTDARLGWGTCSEGRRA